MVRPLRRKSRRRMARIVVDGPITGSTCQRVLKALRDVEEREFPLCSAHRQPRWNSGRQPETCSPAARGPRAAEWWPASAISRLRWGLHRRGGESIVANPGTITGSIGVILRGNDLSRVFERIGIRFDTVKSGVYKDILSPDRPSAPRNAICRRSLSTKLRPVRSCGRGRAFMTEEASAVCRWPRQR